VSCLPIFQEDIGSAVDVIRNQIARERREGHVSAVRADDTLAAARVAGDAGFGRIDTLWRERSS
jgi:hypothetical protein